jgi:membrane protein implicated in regulation of membrane protease activity
VSIGGFELGDIHPGWLWLIGAALLAILELALPGIFLVWLSAASVATALATFALGLDLSLQLVVFGLFSIASVLIGRYVYQRTLHASSDPLLNERAARLFGQTVTVVNAIEGGEGRVKVGDSVWTARGPDAPVGARVRITGAEGSCLRVAQAEAASDPNRP